MVQILVSYFECLNVEMWLLSCDNKHCKGTFWTWENPDIFSESDSRQLLRMTQAFRIGPWFFTGTLLGVSPSKSFGIWRWSPWWVPLPWNRRDDRCIADISGGQTQCHTFEVYLALLAACSSCYLVLVCNSLAWPVSEMYLALALYSFLLGIQSSVDNPSLRRWVGSFPCKGMM